jgi:receptor protein-tyrosine kinase
MEREGERENLALKFTADHPAVRKLDAFLAERQRMMDERRSELIQRLENEYESAMAREQMLADDLEAQSAFVTDQGERSVAYKLLRGAMNEDLSAYENLLQQSKLGAVIAAVRAPNLRVVDDAIPPHSPYKPDLRRSMISGLINGFFLSVALILFRERIDRTLRAPSEIQPSVHIPELGAIPSGQVAPARKRPHADLLAWWREQPELAAAFRGCAESILLRAGSGRVILVTSPKRNAGQTSTIANVGIALTELNCRVLLVDASFRSPRLQEFFGISNELGFADVLKEKGALQPYIVARAVHLTTVPRLFVLPGSQRRANLGSLLRDDVRLQLLLQTLRQDFDFVLMTAPPVLEFPDARLLAARSDSSILVFRSGRTSVNEGIAAVERLRRDGVNIAGGILNDCPRHALRANGEYEPYGEYDNYPAEYA